MREAGSGSGQQAQQARRQQRRVVQVARVVGQGPRTCCTLLQAHFWRMRLQAQRTGTSSAQVVARGQAPAWQGSRQGCGQCGSCRWQGLPQLSCCSAWASPAGAAASCCSWWQPSRRLDLPQWQGLLLGSWQGGQGPWWQLMGQGWLQLRGWLQARVQVSQGDAAGPPLLLALLLAPRC